MKLVLLATLLAIFCTMDMTDSAPLTNSEEFAEQLRKIVYDMHNFRIPRATESGNEDRTKRECYPTDPCGWLTYDPPTRRATAPFMPNTCRCPNETYKCVRTGENLSMSAYVYHCRQNTTPDDIEADEEMDYSG